MRAENLFFAVENIVVKELQYGTKKEDKMKIAVTYENGNVFGHFGHTEAFKVYDVENKEIVKSEVVDTQETDMKAWSVFERQRS